MKHSRTVIAATLLLAFFVQAADAQRSSRRDRDRDEIEVLLPPQLETPGNSKALWGIGVIILGTVVVLAATMYPAPRQHDD